MTLVRITESTRTHLRPMLRLSVASLFTAAAVSVLASCSSAPPAEPEPRAEAPSPIERGEYLVTILACNDCHTPFTMGPNGPEPDMTRMLSGHPETVTLATDVKAPGGGWDWLGSGTNTAFAGPWGITYAPNLTPDQNTGLGIWTEDMFMRAIRTGRHMGQSRPVMPPMPWPAYSKLTDEDLRAMFAYLQSIPPIVNHVPDYIPPPAQSQ